MAVLYRTNAQSRAIEEEFLKQGLPYTMVGGVKFYDRKEIKDMLAYLRVLQNPADSGEFPPYCQCAQTRHRRHFDGPSANCGGPCRVVPICRLPKRLDAVETLVPKAKHALAELVHLLDSLREAAAKLTVADLITKGDERFRLSDGTGAGRNAGSPEPYREPCRSCSLWRVNLQSREMSRTRWKLFSIKWRLVSDIDALEDENDRVTMMTLHSAKGLEFPDGVSCRHGRRSVSLMPAHSPIPEEMEEERRLCYVGITRAQKQCFPDKGADPDALWRNAEQPAVAIFGRNSGSFVGSQKKNRSTVKAAAAICERSVKALDE